MADIITLGELLIDLTQVGTDDLGNGVFTAYPGGAPANVAVAATRLGSSAAFIGKVGTDVFGRNLAAVLEKEGIDISGLYFSEKEHTTMAIVSIDSTGEREFFFYRDPGADTQLTPDEAVSAIQKHGLPKILHIGSLSMTTMPGRDACEAALRYAKDNGVLISYDPNYRAALWDSEERAVEMMKSLLPFADFLKVSEEEMLMLTGTSDLSEGSRILAGYGAGIVMITLGAEGVFVRSGELAEVIPGFAVKVADTNGAGDTFLGAMLAQLTAAMNTGSYVWPDSETLKGYVTYANKAASLTCSRSGAIPAMPFADEMKAAMSN